MLSKCLNFGHKLLLCSVFTAVLTSLFLPLTAQNPGLPKACPVKNGHQTTTGSIVLRPQVVVSNLLTGQVGFSQAANVAYDDQDYCQLVLKSGELSSSLWFRDFNLNLPEGSKLYGIAVEFEGRIMGGKLSLMQLQLTDRNGKNFGENKASILPALQWNPTHSGADSLWKNGGINDLWNLTNSTKDINSGNFGFKIQFRNQSNKESILRLDRVRLIIYYQAMQPLCMKDCTFFYVDPVKNASQYHWKIPTGAEVISTEVNQSFIGINIGRLPYGIYEVCVQTESPSGLSSPCCLSFLNSDCSRASVGDRVWRDDNGNGIQDPMEPGIAHAQVQLFDGQTRKFIRSLQTDLSGRFVFDSLVSGYYYLKFSTPGNLISTSSFRGNNSSLDCDLENSLGTGSTPMFYLAPGQQKTDVDAGFFQYSTLGDFVWEDEDGDGIQDATESGIAGIVFYLLNNSGSIIDSTMSDMRGAYTFTKVVTGDYFIKASVSAPYSISSYKTGNNASKDNDFRLNQMTELIHVNFQQVQNDIDLGLSKSSSICGKVWYDRNRDGQRQQMESGAKDIWIYLMDSVFQILDSTKTVDDGSYCFQNLQAPAKYRLKINLNHEYLISVKDSGPELTDNDYGINYFTDLYYLNQSQTIQLDAGFAIDCKDLAPELILIQSIPSCLDTQAVQILFAPTTTPALNPGYAKIFFLIRASDSVIMDFKSFPFFQVDQPGNYFCRSMVYDDSIGSYNYFNINTIRLGISKVHELINDLDAQNLCYSISASSSLVVVRECSSIGGRAWYDYGQDGIQDSKDRSMPNVLVCLTDDAGFLLDSVRTDSMGNYIFSGLDSGKSYRIAFKYLASYNFTLKDASGFENTDSDVHPSGETDLFNLVPGLNMHIDAGMFLNCNISLANLKAMPLEFGCFSGGVQKIRATISGNHVLPAGFEVKYLLVTGIAQRISAVSELPEFEIDREGVYSVYTIALEEIQDGYNTLDLSWLILGNTTLVELGNFILREQRCASISSKGVSFVVDECLNIGGFVWLDSDRDGIQDSLENGFPDQLVILTDKTGRSMDSLKTDLNGNYFFSKKTPVLEYRIFIPGILGYQFSDKGNGSMPDKDSDVDSSGWSDVLSLPGGSLVKVDAGIYPRCVAKAANLYDLSVSSPCYAGIPIRINYALNGPEIIPSGYVRKFILVSDPVQEIVMISDSLFMNLLQAGRFYVYELVYQNDPLSADYFDATTLLRTGLKFKELLQYFNASGKCHSLSQQAALFEIFSCRKIRGIAWEDFNKNGVHESEEPGLESVKVFLYDDQNNLLDSTVTDTLGRYVFLQYAPGDYRISFLNIDKNFSFSPQDQGSDENLDSDVDSFGELNFSVFPGKIETIIDVGMIRPYGSIGDYVWEDVNGDGIRQDIEPGFNGVLLELIQTSTGKPVRRITTSSNATGMSGYYKFEYAPRGKHYVRAVMPDSISVSRYQTGTDSTLDSDFYLLGGEFRTADMDVEVNGLKEDIDLGIFRKSTVGNFVWLDQDKDGIQDDDEEGINDVLVTLYRADSSLYDQIFTQFDSGTEKKGYYEFDDLAPGKYFLSFENFTGLIPTIANAGMDERIDSDADGSNGAGTTKYFDIFSGDNINDIDAGFYSGGFIGNLVWHDKDRDGIQDADETGIPKVRVSLYDTKHKMVDEVMSDDEGRFDLHASTGFYYLRFDAPASYGFTMVNGFAEQDKNSDVNHNNGFGTTGLIRLNEGESILDVDAGLVLSSVLAVQEIRLTSELVQEGVYHFHWNLEGDFKNGMMKLMKYDGVWSEVYQREFEEYEKDREFWFENYTVFHQKNVYFKLLYISDDEIIESNLVTLRTKPNLALELAPNPVRKFVEIKFDAKEPEAEFEILNIQGKILQTGHIHSGISKIDVEYLLSGYYFVRLKTNSGILVKEFLKL